MNITYDWIILMFDQEGVKNYESLCIPYFYVKSKVEVMK